MPIQSYRELRVFKKAMCLVLESYRLTASFPAHERFGLCAQIRRAAVSVPANIAEGHGRTHRGDYMHHLSMARGSVMEIEVLLSIAEQLGYVSTAELASACDHCDAISRMLTLLKRALGSRSQA